MTETNYVTLDSIRSLEMKCKGCSTTIYYPLNQAKAEALEYECSKCHKSWMRRRGDADEFIRNLSKWGLVIEKEGPSLGVELRLGIVKSE